MNEDLNVLVKSCPRCGSKNYERTSYFSKTFVSKNGRTYTYTKKANLPRAFDCLLCNYCFTEETEIDQRNDRWTADNTIKGKVGIR